MQQRALRKLLGFPEGATASKVTGIPAAERLAVLEDLARLHLVQALPPAGRARRPRYGLTPEGRALAERLPPPRRKPPSRPTLASLGPRLDQLEARLGAVEARLARLDAALAARPTEAPRPAAPSEAPAATGMPYEAFAPAAREAYVRLDRAARTLGLVPIPDLRRALGAAVSHEGFNRHLLRLHHEGVVHLMPHDHPASLPEDRQRDALRHPTAGLLYFVRWLTP